MDYYVSAAINLTSIVPATIGLVRFGRIHRTYQPFILILICSFCTEALGIASNYVFKTNAVIVNTSFLLDSLLWLWQFQRWNGLFKKRWQLTLVRIILVACWATEVVQRGGLNRFISLYLIIYGFCLVFLAINQVNELIIEARSGLLRNAKFLICSGVIIFYTYAILAESFFVFDIENNSFAKNIQYIIIFVNLFVNLLYSLATLWIPTRQRFTLPS